MKNARCEKKVSKKLIFFNLHVSRLGPHSDGFARLGESPEATFCNLRRAGFTLFELVVVIFIISLFLALAFPSFTVLGENRIKSDAKKLASIVRYLNDSALSRKETFVMKIDFKKKSLNYSGPDGKRSEIIESLATVEMQSRGMVSEGELTIFFSPLGALEAFSFILRDDGNFITVAFNPLSGRVKIVSSEQSNLKVNEYNINSFKIVSKLNYKIPPNLPFPKGGIMPLFEKEG